MANTFNLGNGNWAQKTEKLLAYNAENDNYKPLPFDFDRASTATRVNKDGLIETVGVDEPRIDFLNNTKGHLLLEPSRQNKITYSEELTTNWTRSSISTPTDANIDAPDGASTVKRLQTNNADGFIAFTYNTGFNQTIGTTYTVSVYAKSYDGTNQLFGLFGNGSGSSDAHSGNLTSTNEWQRFTYTFTASNTSTIGICKGDDRLAFDILFWGFQIEEGSYATSYIPTSGSAVTRSAETCNNAGNSNVFNDSEGVLYAEIAALANDLSERQISIDDGSGNNRIILRYNSVSNNINAYLFNGSVQGGEFNYVANDITEFSKVAFKYKQNDFALWVDGIERATDTSGNTFSADTLKDLSFDFNGSFDFYGKIKDIRVYNTALSDSELQTLTQV